MADAVVVFALVCAVALAFVMVRRRMTRGSACCGERGEAPARLRVADRDKRHYPYQTELSIGNMTCENCAIRVENALNALPDTWAQVSISTHRALVRTKHEPDVAELKRAVSAAGYVVV